MSEHIEVIYKDGVLRPLKPLNFPEDSVLEINVRDISENGNDNTEKIKAFEKWMNNLDPNTPSLTDDQISRESMYEEQIKKQL